MVRGRVEGVWLNVRLSRGQRGGGVEVVAPGQAGGACLAC